MDDALGGVAVAGVFGSSVPAQIGEDESKSSWIEVLQHTIPKWSGTVAAPPMQEQQRRGS